MRFTSLVISGMVLTATACPGQERAMRDLNTKLAARQRDSQGPEDSNELIGDLLTIGAKTSVAKDIQSIITGSGNPESNELYWNILWPKGSALCKADTCCIWKWVAQDMAAKFRGPSLRCNGLARAAVRLGFHDAGAWNKTVGYGGADGSIVLANEGVRPENNGLQEIIAVTQGWYNSYKAYGVGMADLIQMGANVATVVCPLGPRVKTYVGRKDSSRPNADGLLPDVFSGADTLIKLFEQKTIKPHGLTALVGAHTTSQQRFVDPSRANDPQDSTPGVWDVKFYGQTAGTEPTPKRVFKFPSDVALSQHPRIVQEWREFSGSGQDHWNEDYAREYIRVSLLGVNNINELKDCTKVLPPAIRFYINPDQSYITEWLNGGLSKIGDKIRAGETITSSLLKLLGLIFGGRSFVA